MKPNKKTRGIWMNGSNEKGVSQGTREKITMDASADLQDNI